jgi:hypothetical protein
MTMGDHTLDDLFDNYGGKIKPYDKSRYEVAPKALKSPEAPAQKPKSKNRAQGFRAAIQRIAGDDGDKLIQLLMDHAEGKPLIPRLTDGRIGPPIIPTAETALRATIELTHLLGGKPVGQDQILAAEKASRDLAEVQALSDDELEARARAILARGLGRLDAGKDLAESDGELVASTVPAGRGGPE